MPFTNTPAQQTERTQRFNLVGDPQQRNGTLTTKDMRFVNFFPERIPNPLNKSRSYWLRERPGLVFDTESAVTGDARGILYFNFAVWTVVGDKLCRNGVFYQTLSTNSGNVGMSLWNGTYLAMIVLDGTSGWVVKTDNTVTQITDADFPTPHIPCPVEIDGYLFVAKEDTGDIYNSDLEDPLTWTSGNFISAELHPDYIVALAKNNNYLYAIGESSIEFFYDAAIATGSPLQRNDSAIQQMGCAERQTLVETDKEIIFVGTTNNGGRTVWTLTGFTAEEVGDPTVKQSLDELGLNINQAKGTVVRALGHKFYLLSLPTRTWVYDFHEKLWHEWSYTDDATRFLCWNTCDHPDGHSRALHPLNGNILKFSETYAYDESSSGSYVPIYAVATTEKIDFESSNRKTCSRFTYVGDVPNPGSDTPMDIQWSDDDYTTWSTAQTLQINGDMPAITQLGIFRRRAFKMVYNAIYPLRLEGFELDVNIGQS